VKNERSTITPQQPAQSNMIKKKDSFAGRTGQTYCPIRELKERARGNSDSDASQEGTEIAHAFLQQKEKAPAEGSEIDVSELGVAAFHIRKGRRAVSKGNFVRILSGGQHPQHQEALLGKGS